MASCSSRLNFFDHEERRWQGTHRSRKEIKSEGIKNGCGAKPKRYKNSFHVSLFTLIYGKESLRKYGVDPPIVIVQVMQPKQQLQQQ